MDIHELNPKKTIGALVLFVVVILIGFFTMKRPLMTYDETVNQSLKMLVDTADNYFYPYQLPGVINRESTDVILIDLRNKYAFGRGHIPEAQSIPSFDMAKEENLELLKNYQEEGVTVVLYADNQLDANGAWFFFRQVGFENIRVLLGGYDFYVQHKNDLEATRNDNSFLRGIPRYDFAKVAKSTVPANENNQDKGKKVTFIRRKKTAVAAGGC